MNFLAPIYFVALAALAVPVFLHLIRRQTKQNQEFSSLMFLTPSTPRVNKRSRIENWLLLLMRAAILGLFAFAFTRPFMTASADIALRTDARLRIILVDRSASMGREDLWDQAINHAKESINDLTDQDFVSVIAYDQSADVLIDARATSEANQASSKQQALDAIDLLEKTGVTSLATQHAVALQAAVEQLESFQSSSAWTAATIVEAILISDMQAGEHLEKMRSLQWPEKLQLVMKPARPKRELNSTASLLGKLDASSSTSSEDAENAKSMTRYRVRLDNDSVESKVVANLRWLNPTQSMTEKVVGSFELLPAQSRVIQIDGPTFESGSLQLEGDEVDFENSFYFYQPKPKRKELVYLTERKNTSDGQELGYFLQKIPRDEMPDLPQVTLAKELRTPPTTPEGSEQSDAPKANTNSPALVICNSDILADSAASIREYVMQGGTLLIVLDQVPSQPAEMQAWWQAMFDGATAEIKEASVKDFLLWQNIDFRSSIFAPFNDPKSNNFAKIHFWKARSIQLSDPSRWKTLVSFDSNEPALLQRSLGTGSVYVLTSGWQVSDSQLALSTKFVPLLLNMIASPMEGKSQATWTVGVPVALEELSDVASIGLPNGTEVSIDGTSFLPQSPGIHECKTKDGQQRVVAVNLPRSECRTRPITFDQFEQYGINLGRMSSAVELQQNARQMRNTELEANQQWWRWLLVAGLALVGCETAISARCAKTAEGETV